MESMDLGISAVLDQVFSVFSRSDFENFENPFDDLKRAAWSRQRLTISSSTGARRSSRHLRHLLCLFFLSFSFLLLAVVVEITPVNCSRHSLAAALVSPVSVL